MARIPEELRLRTSVMLTDRSTNPVVEVARRFSPDLLVTSLTTTDYVSTPYSSPTQIVSAIDHVPMLALGPKGIGDAFCDSSNMEPADLLTANVS
jgi:hypothetical protein